MSFSVIVVNTAGQYHQSATSSDTQSAAEDRLLMEIQAMDGTEEVFAYGAVRDDSTGKIVFTTGTPPPGTPSSWLPNGTTSSSSSWILYGVVGVGLAVLGIAVFAAHKSSSSKGISRRRRRR